MSNRTTRKPSTARKSAGLKAAKKAVRVATKLVETSLREYEDACVTANLAKSKLERLRRRQTEMSDAVVVDDDDEDTLPGPAAAVDSILAEIARVEADTAVLRRRHAALATKLGLDDNEASGDGLPG